MHINEYRHQRNSIPFVDRLDDRVHDILFIISPYRDASMQYVRMYTKTGLGFVLKVSVKYSNVFLHLRARARA